MRLWRLLILGLAVALFLLLRNFFDEKVENALDIEVVREDEEFLGNWASKTGESLIQFRLRRDQRFTWKLVKYPKGDTITIEGKYDIIGPSKDRTAEYYPRLIAVDQNNDTLFNYFIAYVTPYDTKVEKVDRLVLNPNSIYDTVSYTFYRVKP
ncbi:MAG TPA: hypothetical protein VFZ47_11880 [Chitinophagaceae bacterium]